MKICYLSDAGSVHTVKWAQYFKNKGHDVFVISLRKGDIDGVRVYSCTHDGREEKNDFSKLMYLKSVQRVREILKSEKPDILHVHYATSYGLLGALSKYEPMVLSVWGADVYDFPKKSKLHKSILKYNLKHADYVLSTSRHMAAETACYTDKPIYVTPFGVDLNKFTPGKDRSPHKTIVGTVKTLKPKYGISYLIEAFAEVLDQTDRKDLYLHIAGDGPQREALERLAEQLGIRDRVSFLGFLDENEVIRTFQSFDIAVFPSTLDSESFGVAAVEAQACEIPVIVSDVGGLPEATDPNRSSLVVPKENVDALADAIKMLLENKEQRSRMGKQGRKYVEENYNIDDNFEYVDQIYRGILEETPL